MLMKKKIICFEMLKEGWIFILFYFICLSGKKQSNKYVKNNHACTLPHFILF